MKCFSSVFAVFLMVNTICAQQRAASVNYARAVAEARTLVEKGKQAGRYPTVPEPPSYEPTCEKSKEQEERKKKFETQREEYYRDLLKEELRVTANIVEADKALMASGSKSEPVWTSVAGDVFTYVAIPKINSLLRQYGGKSSRRDKFNAVAYVAITVAKQVASLGGETRLFLDELGSWAARNVEEGLKKLRDEHDYTQVRPVIESHRDATALSAVSPESFQDLIKRLVKVMTFKLKLEGTYDMQSGGGGGHITTQAEIELTPDGENLAQWTGRASGKYTSGELKTDEGIVNITLLSFPIVAKLENFDPCKSMTVDVLFDRIGAETDQMTYQGRPLPTYAGGKPISMVETPGKAIFALSGNYQPSTGFTFVRQPLHNKQQIAVDETVDQSQNQEGGKASARIHIQLVHSPK